MTPSSPSEPELETQPAKTSPPGTPAPTSSDAPIDPSTGTPVGSDSPAVAESSSEKASTPATGSDSATPGEPAAESAPTTEAPVVKAKPARKRAAPKAKPVVAPTEPVEAAPVTETSPVETSPVVETAAETTPIAKAAPIETPAAEAPATDVPATPATEAPVAPAATPVFADPSTASPAAETTTLPKDETVVLPGSGGDPEAAEVLDNDVEITPMTDEEAREYEALNRDHGDVGGTDYEVLANDRPAAYPTLVPLVGALVGLVAVAALLIVSFALPAVHSGPHKLPIGVAGSTEITGQLKQLFATGDSTAFDVTAFTKEADLRSAIEDNELYGGLSVNESAITMLVSSGASTTAAEALSGIANSLSAQAGQQIPVTDVVPLPKDDAQGKGLAAINLPLVAAAVFPALILIPLYRRRTAAQLGIAVGASVLIGLALSAILSFVIGTTKDSNFLLVSVGLAAGVLATSLLLLGLSAIGGRIGLGIGAAVLLLFAAPLSGLTTAPEWLPNPWGVVGQLLPPGANASLLRSTAYFDGHGFASDTLVLLAWGLVGLLLIGLGTLLKSTPTEGPAPIEA